MKERINTLNNILTGFLVIALTLIVLSAFIYGSDGCTTYGHNLSTIGLILGGGIGVVAITIWELI